MMKYLVRAMMLYVGERCQIISDFLFTAASLQSTFVSYKIVDLEVTSQSHPPLENRHFRAKNRQFLAGNFSSLPTLSERFLGGK